MYFGILTDTKAILYIRGDNMSYEVCRVYYDSPREDCSGYYQDIYEFPTAKDAWKAYNHWNRSEEPEGASHDLTSGKPRRYETGLFSIKEPGKKCLVEVAYDYETFQKNLKDARKLAKAFGTKHYMEIKDLGKVISA